MEETIWSVLGIEATMDESAIYRAYATRLKNTSPEANAAGYMKLRAAYEQAKVYVQRQQYIAAMEQREKESAGEAAPESSGDAEDPAPEAAADADANAESPAATQA